MATYVMSDLHGRLDLFDEMIRQIDFSDSDTLYILGDVVDRGGNLDLLFKLQNMKNVKLILGNHEHILLSLIKAVGLTANKREGMQRLEENLNTLRMNRRLKNNLFLRLMNTINSIGTYVKQIDFNEYKRISLYNSYSDFSSCYTKDSLNELTDDQMLNLIEYLDNLPAKVEIDVNGQHYILVHAAYDYNKRNDIEYTIIERDNFFKSPVNYGTGSKGIVIFGHTTTRDILIKTENRYVMPYKIWHDSDKIGIDCAAAYPGGRLACLRLDDMQEFYVDNHNRFLVSVDYLNQKAKNVWEYERKVSERHRKSYDEPLFSVNRTEYKE